MGKRSKPDQLLDYIGSIKEHQDHQYVKGYWMGKQRLYDFKNYPKKNAWPLIFSGVLLLSFGLMMLFENYHDDSFEFYMIGVYIVLLALGVLFIWTGLKVWNRAKKK
jgi:hypothetical protein